jgi:hypothetical protein
LAESEDLSQETVPSTFPGIALVVVTTGLGSAEGIGVGAAQETRTGRRSRNSFLIINSISSKNV